MEAEGDGRRIVLTWLRHVVLVVESDYTLDLRGYEVGA